MLVILAWMLLAAFGLAVVVYEVVAWVRGR
jgi:hypothetical protein